MSSSQPEASAEHAEQWGQCWATRSCAQEHLFSRMLCMAIQWMRNRQLADLFSNEHRVPHAPVPAVASSSSHPFPSCSQHHFFFDGVQPFLQFDSPSEQSTNGLLSFFFISFAAAAATAGSAAEASPPPPPSSLGTIESSSSLGTIESCASSLGTIASTSSSSVVVGGAVVVVGGAVVVVGESPLSLGKGAKVGMSAGRSLVASAAADSSCDALGAAFVALWPGDEWSCSA
mmetsp:Transcript_92349/g.232283  ORF Transcript_92349/g.232283 Transcript_92349/m.232283 type:complete len:231 (-) Transcript_92349:791-1483(-)